MKGSVIMGLFRFFKKETPNPDMDLFFASTEEFLQGEESDAILLLVKDVIKFDYDYNKATVIPILEQYWGSENCDKKYLLKQTLPYCLYSDKEEYRLNAERLLKLLASRGDCHNATFCLAVLYQIGVFQVAENNAEFVKYLEVALEQNSALANMIKQIEEVKLKPGLVANEKEALAVTLNPLNIKMYYKSLYDTLSQKDVEDLRFIYTVCIGWMTSLGYPLSTMFLSTPTLNWKEEVASEKTITNQFVKGVSHSCGEWMIRRLIKSARGGNSYAINALKNFNYDYRCNYN